LFVVETLSRTTASNANGPQRATRTDHNEQRERTTTSNANGPTLTTFDWHILRRLVTGYVFLIVALIIFFILLHYLEYVDDFLDRQAPMKEIYTIYYPSYIPEIVRLISPLALFLSCVYLTGKLAQTMQLTALQTSGVSLYRLLRPYLLVAVLVTGLMVWFNGWIVPVTNRTVLDYDSKYLKSAPRQVDTNDIHRQNRPGSIVSVAYFDRNTNTAMRVSLQRFDENQHLVERIDAQQMVWADSLSRWHLPDAVVRTFSEDGGEVRRVVSELDTVLLVYRRCRLRRGASAVRGGQHRAAPGGLLHEILVSLRQPDRGAPRPAAGGGAAARRPGGADRPGPLRGVCVPGRAETHRAVRLYGRAGSRADGLAPPRRLFRRGSRVVGAGQEVIF
jgi:hypothetical protein